MNILVTALQWLFIVSPSYALSEKVDTSVCAPIPAYEDKRNKHALQTWQNDIFKSFLQDKGNPYYEMPAGWMAIGAEDIKQFGEKTCVRFPGYQSATFVDPAHFKSQTLQVEGVYFPIKVVWRNTMTPEQEAEYLEVIERGFRDVSRLYPYGAPNSMLSEHTVMITAGVITDKDAPMDVVYPNVGHNASYIYRWPEPRMEELLLHAVAHLYNRFRFMYSYRPTMPTLYFGEYQEYVASWVESRFIKSDKSRWERALRLFHIHEVIVRDDVPRSREVGGFRRLDNLRDPISANVFKHKPPHKTLKKEYAHYILAPLLLIAVDGVLADMGSDMTVEKILTDVHTNRFGINFYGVLGMHLKPEQMDTYRRWEEGLEPIPRNYIIAGLKRYDTGVDPVNYDTVVDDFYPKVEVKKP